MPANIQMAKRLVELLEDTKSSNEQIRQTARSLLQAARGTSASNLRNVLDLLSVGLDLEDPLRASTLLMTCGALVEFGAKSDRLQEPLIRNLRTFVDGACKFRNAVVAELPTSDDKDFDRNAAFEATAKTVAKTWPRPAACWTALERSYLAGIAVFSLSREARQLAKRELAGIQQLADDHPGASWLWKLLQVLDDEPLLVIDPAKRLGVVGRMNGIAENFQLNVLLMAAFPRGWFSRRRVSKNAASVARGTGPQQTDETIIGVWNLYTADALQSDQSLPDPNDYRASTNWIWNEGIPADIPVVLGHRVVLLGSTSYARSWGSQRAFNHLRADITDVRKLSVSEVANWLDQLISLKSKTR